MPLAVMKSGWTRLWIVFTAIIWIVGAWHTFTIVGAPPPGRNASDNEVCWYAVEKERPVSFAYGCGRDPDVTRLARADAAMDAAVYPMRFYMTVLPWLALPWLVLLAWGQPGIRRWVRGGTFHLPPD